MADKTIEMMKKIIEEKNKKSSEQVGTSRANKNIGEARSKIKKYKKGGLFDK